MQGGALRGGNDPLGGTARWPHAPGGLPSAYDQAFHRADDEEPVDVSDEQVAELQGKVDENRSSIATNAAIIQALREALNGRGG